jgi:hypothetical protein
MAGLFVSGYNLFRNLTNRGLLSAVRLISSAAGRQGMPDAAYFRQQAEHCRKMAKIAINPDLPMQLLRFADDFNEKARELDALSESPDKQP